MTLHPYLYGSKVFADLWLLQCCCYNLDAAILHRLIVCPMTGQHCHRQDLPSRLQVLEGQDLISQLEKTPVDRAARPQQAITIANSGLL